MTNEIKFPKDDEAINLGYQQSLDDLLTAIRETFDPDSTLCIEGTIAPDVKAFLESVRLRPDVAVERGTTWPRRKVFHIPVTEENLNSLLELSGKHAEPEMCEHLVVYKGNKFLLWAHDAFDGFVYVSPDLDSHVIESLRQVVERSTPGHKRAFSERLYVTSQLEVAARELRDKYGHRVAEQGGVLGVRLERASNLRQRVKTVGLIADVTWEEARIYDHRHGEVLMRRWFSGDWEQLRSVPEAVDLIEDQIQKWIATGPPS